MIPLLGSLGRVIYRNCPILLVLAGGADHVNFDQRKEKGVRKQPTKAKSPRNDAAEMHVDSGRGAGGLRIGRVRGPVQGARRAEVEFQLYQDDAGRRKRVEERTCITEHMKWREA